jgi:hypothetical protein
VIPGQRPEGMDKARILGPYPPGAAAGRGSRGKTEDVAGTP